MKHTIHKWGVDISSIHEVIGPQYTSIPTNPNQKNENFHEKIKFPKSIQDLGWSLDHQGMKKHQFESIGSF